MLAWIETLEVMQELGQLLYFNWVNYLAVADPEKTPANTLLQVGIRKYEILELRKGCQAEALLHEHALIDWGLMYNTMGFHPSRREEQ